VDRFSVEPNNKRKQERDRSIRGEDNRESLRRRMNDLLPVSEVTDEAVDERVGREILLEARVIPGEEEEDVSLACLPRLHP